jgi:hypothetical protein
MDGHNRRVGLGLVAIGRYAPACTILCDLAGTYLLMKLLIPEKKFKVRWQYLYVDYLISLTLFFKTLKRLKIALNAENNNPQKIFET